MPGTSVLMTMSNSTPVSNYSCCSSDAGLNPLVNITEKLQLFCRRSVEHHKLPKSAQDCLECLRGRPHIVRARQDLHSRMYGPHDHLGK